MKRITDEDIQKAMAIGDPAYSMFETWGMINEALIKFENQATVEVFRFLFGDPDGIRLWENFKLRCSGTYRAFDSYLTPAQRNELLANAYYNQEMYTL